VARRSILEEDDGTRIDLSSMIDCIFILLIFFIVATVFVEEKGLEVAKPEAGAPSSVAEGDSVVLRISAEDEVLFEEQRIALAEVTGRVRERLQGGEGPVIIRAHEKASHGVFIGVWDAARRAGAQKLAFHTVN
jgi:biopolymer transport protein ExbD